MSRQLTHIGTGPGGCSQRFPASRDASILPISILINAVPWSRTERQTVIPLHSSRTARQAYILANRLGLGAAPRRRRVATTAIIGRATRRAPAAAKHAIEQGKPHKEKEYRIKTREARGRRRGSAQPSRERAGGGRRARAQEKARPTSSARISVMSPFLARLLTRSCVPGASSDSFSAA